MSVKCLDEVFGADNFVAQIAFKAADPLGQIRLWRGSMTISCGTARISRDRSIVLCIDLEISRVTGNTVFSTDTTDAKRI